MNMAELYQKMPVDKRGNIEVMDGRVFVKHEDGVEEYLIESDGELWMMPSPIKEFSTRVKGLEQKLAELKAMVAR